MSTHPLEPWMLARGWQPLDHQRDVWQARSRGEEGLLLAPTGHGKSLAGLGCVLRKDVQAGGLRLLWITPLRALAQDLAAELALPLSELRPDWQVQSRSGDTSAYRKQQQRKRLPEVLITTPESASLLLSYGDLLPALAQIDTVVVDEWHELIANKRGIQTQLVLAALRQLNPALRVWGLSATLGNAQQAGEALVGPNPTLIHAQRRKQLEIHTLLPKDPQRISWAGHLGLKMLDQVKAKLLQAGSTLLFANTRAQAELWFEALTAEPELQDQVGLHHGSLDASVRQAAEQGLKTGTLRCVVATSSLDLGVDFSPVEQVIQIGSPRTLARLVQRAGRAGHQPGAVSRILCVPTHTLEMAEFAAARQAWAEGRMEPRQPLTGSLDVLSQHVLTRCLGQPQDAEQLYAEVQQAPAYAALSRKQWDWVLDFLGRGGEVLRAYPEYHRLQTNDQGRLMVSNATTARRHRMMIGTIAADSTMSLRWTKGGRIGQVEEAFIARLKPGDSFLFAGRALELVRVQGLTAYARLARGKRVAVPRWSGGRLPLSESLAAAFVTQLQQGVNGPEHQALQPLLALQQQQSALPSLEYLLVESLRSREGWHLCLYPCAGRAVHEGLGALLAHRASQTQPRSITVAANDYGLELLSSSAWPEDHGWLKNLLSIQDLEQEIELAMNATELAKRHFREIAQAAGLVFTGYPGRGKSARQVQMSTGLLFDVFARYDPDNPLLHQTRDEVRLRELDWPRLERTVKRLSQLPLRWTHPQRLTPFAFPLYAEAQRQQLSTESLADRLQRMQQQLERAAGDIE